MNFEIVITLDQAEDMRRIRNTCREFMTHNQEEISAQEQAKWYHTYYKPNFEMGNVLGLLYLKQGNPIGYGLVRKLEEKTWISGGLIPKERGKGLGKGLFKFLTTFVTEGWKEAVYLDVLETNLNAIKLYLGLGYSEIGREDNLIIMKYGGSTV